MAEIFNIVNIPSARGFHVVCYDISMQNWDYDLTTAAGPAYTRFKLERMINYGLKPDERLPIKPLKALWKKLNIEPQRRRFLEMLLWKK